jgi:hypothetical protein
MKPITIMIIISFCIHVAVFTLLTLLPWFSSRKIQVPLYAVTLITQAPPKTPQAKTEVMKKPAQKPPKKPKEKPVTVKKPKPKKKVPPKKKPARDDVISEKRIQAKMESAIEELRKKTEPEEKPKVTEETAQPSPKPSRAAIDMRLRTYYNTIWQRIKEEWILPPGLFEESPDLETVIVIKVQRDGGIMERWFEKKSGIPMYDESAMRAIQKANPLPPFPEELDEDFLEIGIRFHPE